MGLVKKGYVHCIQQNAVCKKMQLIKFPTPLNNFYDMNQLNFQQKILYSTSITLSFLQINRSVKKSNNNSDRHQVQIFFYHAFWGNYQVWGKGRELMKIHNAQLVAFKEKSASHKKKSQIILYIHKSGMSHPLVAVVKKSQ